MHDDENEKGDGGERGERGGGGGGGEPFRGTGGERGGGEKEDEERRGENLGPGGEKGGEKARRNLMNIFNPLRSIFKEMDGEGVTAGADGRKDGKREKRDRKEGVEDGERGGRPKKDREDEYKKQQEKGGGKKGEGVERSKSPPPIESLLKVGKKGGKKEGGGPAVRARVPESQERASGLQEKGASEGYASSLLSSEPVSIEISDEMKKRLPWKCGTCLHLNKNNPEACSLCTEPCPFTNDSSDEDYFTDRFFLFFFFSLFLLIQLF